MISVIVPVYNGERTIEACLRSILAQSCRDLELIVVDDGSEDESRATCRRISETDSRVRLLCQNHAGVSVARNRGLREAKGKFITFVDADDLLPPDALETLHKAMENGADFVIGSHSYFRWGREKNVIRRQDDSLDRLMSMMCGKLYRRELLRENRINFREDLPYGEDTVFNLQYYCYAFNIAVLEQIVYRCRMGGMASSCRYYPNRAEIARILVESYARHCEAEQLHTIAYREYTETVMHYLVHCTAAEARLQIDGAAELLRPYLPEPPPLKKILRQHGKRILLRRMKRYIRGHGL